MSKTATQAETATIEQKLKDAGFREEKVGGTSVFEREVPESVVEATRVFIQSNNIKGKADVNGSNGSNGKGAAVLHP